MGHHPDGYASIVDVCVLLQRADGWVLLAERANTGFSDGQLGVPGGRLEAGESVAAGAARELAEETGVVVDPVELELLHVAHHTGGVWEPGWGSSSAPASGSGTRITASRSCAPGCTGSIPVTSLIRRSPISLGC
jgi:8-oxo-dGTP pyrophosphatase MutT (NUDIX family)